MSLFVTKPRRIPLHFKHGLRFASRKKPAVRIMSGLKKRRRKRHRHATNIDREMAVVKSNGNMPISFEVPGTALTVGKQRTLQPSAEFCRRTEYMWIETWVVKWIIIHRIRFKRHGGCYRVGDHQGQELAQQWTGTYEYRNLATYRSKGSRP